MIINSIKPVKIDLSPQTDLGEGFITMINVSSQDISLTSHLKMNQRLDGLGVLQNTVHLALSGEAEVGGVEGGRVADDVHR